MSVGFVIALLLAVVAVVGAWKMIFSHHPVHSALYLVLCFCATAGLYLTLGAPFIAVVQVAVYAGAIMVLFLFIIMYLNLGLSRDVVDDRARRLLSVALAAGLAALLLAGGAVRWRGTVAGVGQVQQRAAAAAIAQHGETAGGGGEEGSVARQVVRADQWRPVSVEEIGVTLFSRWTLPFEVASLLLLIAMIGTLVISRPQLAREQQNRGEARP